MAQGRSAIPVVDAAECCPSVLAAPLAPDEADGLARGLHALGDPVRLRVLSMLAAAPEGEICVCGSRLLLERPLLESTFLDRLVAQADAFVLGDPFDPATQLGPVISARQYERVLSYCGFGREDGARLLAGGGPAKVPGHENGYFVQPPVFADVTSKMRIFQEEVFGPFTSVTRFTDEADALRLANDSPFGLAAAIRTKDVARAHRLAAKVKAGIVWINDHQRLDPASPWGGVDDSGIGREFGTESFNDHFNVKSVMVATHDQPFDWYRDTATQVRLN